MERKNNSTPSSRSSSICSRIRQALGSYPAFRAIHRIKQQHNRKPEPKPIITITNPPLPQHVKVMNTKEGGALIPINFDYSTTTPPPPSSSSKGNNYNENSSLSSTSSKVVSPHHIKVEPRKGNHHHGLGIQQQHSSEQQQHGKKSLDINDTFAEYIQRTRYNIRRSASNVGRSQGNSASSSSSDHEASNSNAIKMENQKDPFSDFIQRAGKRLRTTSNVAKAGGGSFKRG